jgi:hypothetical protein
MDLTPVLEELREINRNLEALREAVLDVGVAVGKIKPCGQELPPEVREQLGNVAGMFAGTPLAGAFDALLKGGGSHGQ